MTRDVHPFVQRLRDAGLVLTEPLPLADDTGAGQFSPPPGDGQAARYAEAALSGELAKVTGAVEGTRNDTLNRAAFKLGQLVDAGHLDADRVVTELTRAATTVGLPVEEIRRTVPRAVRDGAGQPRLVHLNGGVPAAYTLDNGWAAAPAGAALQHAEPIRLDRFLEVPDEPVLYRIDRLLPIGARFVVAAQFKAGKSTLGANLLRSFADGDPFLGEFDVTDTGQSIVLIDDELDPRTLRRWLREQNITNTHRIHVVSLRGRINQFNLMDPTVLGWWAKTLRSIDAGILLLDCLRPVLDALGLSEDKDAGKFLVRFDELLLTAGVGEAGVIHHMGHQGERGRGDSRLRDWPDNEWKIVRPPGTGDDGQPLDDPSAARFFSAFGRDVDVPERQLGYDSQTRQLTYTSGDRRTVRADAALTAVLTYLRDEGPATKRKVEDEITGRAEVVRSAWKAAIESGWIAIDTSGPRGAHILSLTQSGHAYSTQLVQLAPARPDELDEVGRDLVPSPIGDEVVDQRLTPPPQPPRPPDEVELESLFNTDTTPGWNR